MLKNEKKLQQTLQFQTQLTIPRNTLNGDNKPVFIMKMILNLKLRKSIWRKLQNNIKYFLI